MIFFPRFKSNTGKKLGEFYGFKMDRRLHLDEYGTAVWKLCDGERTVAQIVDELIESYEVSREELERDVEEFVADMEGRGWLERA